MEAFTLLNYWKNSSGSGGGGGGGSGISPGGLSFLPPSSGETTTTTTIVTSATNETDEGPFFDLEFALPVEDAESEESPHGEGDSDCTDGGCEFNITLSPCSGEEERIDSSPSGDVYFQEQTPEDDEEEVDPPSTGTEQTCSVKAPAAQLSASILKSATKLRVFMLRMRKPKLINTKPEANSGSGDSDDMHHHPPPPPPPPPPPSQSPQQKSTVAVSLKVEDVPIISLFTRENSSRNCSSSSSSSSSGKKQNGNESVVSDEKRFVMMQNYLKKVKPLYIRVSRRYGEKLRHSSQLTFGSSSSSSARSAAEKAESPATKTNKTGNINIPAGLKVVRKHLGKSRSSSSTTPATSTAETVMSQAESRRRDDSLLQQQDSIQSAILHCKRSFNSSRDNDPTVLPRSVSDSEIS